jgi:hypothetical protein
MLEQGLCQDSEAMLLCIRFWDSLRLEKEEDAGRYFALEYLLFIIEI